MKETLARNESLERVAAALAGQWLYRFGDEGVVYSEAQNRFAGLDAAGLAAYQAFEEGATVEDLICVSSGRDHALVSAYALEEICRLAQGIFPSQDSPQEWLGADSAEFVTRGAGIWKTGTSKTERIEVDGIPVLVEYPAGPLEPLCRDYFQRCPATTRAARCHLRAQQSENGWAIYINGSEFLSLQQEEQLGLGLMHAARAMLYAEGEYDIAFHAAAVAHLDHGLLLCAPREGGKSTLTTYLLAHGYDFLTDEPAFLHLGTGTVSPLPLPISLQQGSWPILRQEFPHAPSGPVHVRSDGVKILLVHSPAGSQADQPRRLANIVFPQYQPAAEGRAERLSPMRTLNLLTDSGMLLARNLGRERFEDFLRLLSRTPAHEIRYNSLKEAYGMIRELDSSMP